MSTANRGSARPIFTDEELQAIRMMSRSFLPEVIYQQMISVCQKIDRYFGKKEEGD